MWNVMNRSLACHSSFWNLRIWIFGEAVGSVTPWRFSLGSNVEFAHVWSLFASTRIKMVRLSWRRMARQFFLLSSWFGTKQRECCSSLLFIVIQWYVSQNEMCGTLQTSVRTVQANTLSTCNAATLQDKTEMLDSESFSHSGCFELGVAMVVIAGQQVGLWRKARRGSEDFRKTIELSWILPSCGHVEAARHDFLVHRYDVCQHQVHGVGKSM